jgi:hypothetical protein
MSTAVTGGRKIWNNFLQRPISTVDVKPISPSTGSGTAAIYQPPTVEAPPSAAQSVMQAVNTSQQLAENTATSEATPSYLATLPGGKNYWLLGGLAVVLLLAYAWDKGKL